MINKLIAQRVLKKAGIEQNITALEPLGGGRQHDVFLLSLTNKQHIVLKNLSLDCYLGHYSASHFEYTEQLASYIDSKLNCAVAALNIKGTKHYTISDNGAFFLIFPFCEGTIEHHLSGEQCYIMGRLLANIHNLKPIELPLTPMSFSPFKIEQWSELLNGYIEPSTLELFIQLADRCYQTRNAYKGLRVLSHRDINLENILWLRPDKPMLIDWESAGLIQPGVELIGLAFNMAGISNSKLDLEKLRLTVKGYCSASDTNINQLLTEDLYYQAYATWFKWLDYCLNFKMLKNRSEELRLTVSAILRMYQYKNYLLK